MKRSVQRVCLGAAAALLSLPALALESWSVVMCNPAPTCMGDCRPMAMVRQQSAGAPPGCMVVGTYPNYEFAKRNADSMNGRAPTMMGGMNTFDSAYQEGERYRFLGDMGSALRMYQEANNRAASFEEVLMVGEALSAAGDKAGAVSALVRARDMASRKVQFTLVGDAFTKMGRTDQAQIAYDRARTASQ